jgi:pyruvate kinase
MITSLIPTFSEMCDISNLVNEDVDAIMLTGETTYGNYPIQSVATLNRVCQQVETN